MKLFKSKIEEIKETLYDRIIKRDKKIEETEKKNYESRKDPFKPEEDYYKPIKIGNDFSSNYAEYKSNGDKDKTLSIEEYLDETKPYLIDTSGKWKIQLTMAI